MPIAIIDYGAGNLRSVEKALTRLGFDSAVTSDINIIKNSSGIILPGVGAFDPAIYELKEKNLFSLIIEEIKKGKLFLGLCLGMQLLFEKSEEGSEKGFGLIKGNVARFTNYKVQSIKYKGEREILQNSYNLKIPQMGWNNIKIIKTSPILKDIPDNSMMYFVHSYYCDPTDKEIISTTTDYGVTFASSVSKDNIFALQFHPEKSGDVGLKILRNFGEMCE